MRESGFVEFSCEGECYLPAPKRLLLQTPRLAVQETPSLLWRKPKHRDRKPTSFSFNSLFPIAEYLIVFLVVNDVQDIQPNCYDFNFSRFPLRLLEGIN